MVSFGGVVAAVGAEGLDECGRDHRGRVRDESRRGCGASNSSSVMRGSRMGAGVAIGVSVEASLPDLSALARDFGPGGCRLLRKRSSVVRSQFAPACCETGEVESSMKERPAAWKDWAVAMADGDGSTIFRGACEDLQCTRTTDDVSALRDLVLKYRAGDPT